ncbi:hypothetical protein AB0383_48745 [Amycolatopsis sp. NPDC051373]|uniref:hypothetical protein n=1 Tax=Amycolatopsis sp. NPDC051373 TaxID=3155801 RepID=UPI0034500EB0
MTIEPGQPMPNPERDFPDFRYLFGRLETKIDKMDETLRQVAEKVGRHDERISGLERDMREIQASRLTDQQQEKTNRGGMRIAIIAAIVSSLIGGLFVVIQILTHS